MTWPAAVLSFFFPFRISQSMGKPTWRAPMRCSSRALAEESRPWPGYTDRLDQLKAPHLSRPFHLPPPLQQAWSAAACCLLDNSEIRLEDLGRSEEKDEAEIRKETGPKAQRNAMVLDNLQKQRLNRARRWTNSREKLQLYKSKRTEL